MTGPYLLHTFISDFLNKLEYKELCNSKTNLYGNKYIK